MIDPGHPWPGDQTLQFLEMFRSAYFADLSLNQWMGLTPPELVKAHLNLDKQTMARLPKDKPVIVSSQEQRPQSKPRHE
jgi:oxalate decarboxylase